MKTRNQIRLDGRVNRRELLELLGVGGVALAIGCGSTPTTPSTTTASGGGAAIDTTTAASGCAVTSQETAGPYPDKLGMVNNSAFFRRDVTEGKAGLSLTLALTIVNAGNSCGPVANANVEIWHCDATG